MNIPKVPRPSRLDKVFRLHTPTYMTTPPSCITCGATIRNLEAWLDSECPGAPAHEEAA